MKLISLVLILFWLALLTTPAVSQDGDNIIRHCRSIESLAWSPDSTMLAVQGAGGTAIYDRDMQMFRMLEETEFVNIRNTRFNEYLDEYTLCWGRGVAWHPQQHLVAAPFIEEGNTWTKLWDVDTGTVHQTLPAPQYRYDTSDIAFSPNKPLLAYAQRSEIYGDRQRDWDIEVRDVDEFGVAEFPLIVGFGRTSIPLIALSWNSSAQLAVAGADGTLWIWEVNEAVEQVFEQKYSFSLTDVAWHPIENFIALTSSDSNIYIVDAETGEISATIDAQTSPIQTLDWNSSGSHIAAGTLDGSLYVWNVKSNEVVISHHGHTGSVVDLDWSPDDQLIATASLDDTVRIWEVDLAVDK